MLPRLLLALLALCGAGASAQAADAAAPALPRLALDPPPEPSPWAGLYVGSELFAVSGKGLSRGGVGGAGFVGYDHQFDNRWVLGIQGSAGYSPNLLRFSRIGGFDFAAANLRAGYTMGRVTPFVTAGIGFAEPNARPFPAYTGAGDSINSLFNAPGGELQAVGSVGAGVAYAITNDMSVELAVSAHRGPGGVWP